MILALLPSRRIYERKEERIEKENTQTMSHHLNCETNLIQFISASAFVSALTQFCSEQIFTGIELIQIQCADIAWVETLTTDEGLSLKI